MSDKIKPSYYAIIEADVRYDKKLSSTAKLIYAEITALTQKEGYAWASNKYFADNFSISSSQVSRVITQLANRGYIDVYIQDNYLRKITIRKNEHPLRKKAGGVTQKAQGGVTQKAQHNNTSVNTKNNNTNTNNDTLLKELLNKVTGRNFRVLPNGYKKTLKEFTLEEIEKALLAMKKDKWHSERWGSLKSDYLIRSSTIDNFLNKKSSGYNQSVSAEDLYGDGSWMK